MERVKSDFQSASFWHQSAGSHLENSMTQTVFIVDDDDSVRTALLLLLNSVGLHAQAFASASQFLDAYRPEYSGCLVLDIRMPGLSGMDLQQSLLHLDCDIPIIFITGHGDVTQAVQAMRIGAFDFLEKPFRDQQLLDRVGEALRMDTERREARIERDEARSRLCRLTPREQEVANRLAIGQSNKVIAIELGLSERTVEIHRAHVMRKTDSRSLADLLTLITRAGIA